MPERARRLFEKFVAAAGSDAKAAEILGCSRSYVHHIRGARRTPGITVAAAISRESLRLCGFAIPAEMWSEGPHPRSPRSSRKVRRKHSAGS